MTMDGKRGYEVRRQLADVLEETKRSEIRRGPEEVWRSLCGGWSG